MHLSGYALSLQDLKNFRQLHSKTPGHPEYKHTPGVETTTGPLGQGLANAVGMAIAEKILAEQFNDALTTLVDHYTYAFVGDGCLMEGISHEVASFAGCLGLGKLIVFYDDNDISIDGPVSTWFADDSSKRFEAYAWQVFGPIDGHDHQGFHQAIQMAQAETGRPSLIRCKTIIGYGSPQAGQAETHGSPLGPEAVATLRHQLNWPYPAWEIPAEIYQAWDHTKQGQHAEHDWLTACFAYQRRDPERYTEFLRRINGDLPDDWQALKEEFHQACLSEPKAMATRKASQRCIEYYARICPELLGGSADLTGSNNTDWSGTKAITASDWQGNYLHYGVREFGMSAIMTGIALHGGFIPYGGTFLVFSDYARSAIRMAALMQQRVIFILSHDSIGLGEDGPTHQPIEHISMLRLTPNLKVWRPADLMETAIAWEKALNHHTGPSCLLLSRQSLPAIPRTGDPSADIGRGAYVVLHAAGIPELIIMATGSEVSIALEAGRELEAEGVKVRVISIPCMEEFLAQEPDYQEKILPKAVRKRIAIEAGATGYWYRLVGLDGAVIGIDRFGESAPAAQIYQYLGLSVQRIKSESQRLMLAI